MTSGRLATGAGWPRSIIKDFGSSFDHHLQLAQRELRKTGLSKRHIAARDDGRKYSGPAVHSGLRLSKPCVWSRSKIDPKCIGVISINQES